jgi:Ca2+-binding RTX toxin-like protein
MATQFNDLLLGSIGSDLIDGLEGDDTIFGLAGNDSLYGGMGQDYKAGGLGQDRLDFERVVGSNLAGDTINLSGLNPRSIFVGYAPTAPLGVKVNLNTGSVAIGSLTVGGTTISWGYQVQNFEDVIGSAFHDSIIGNAVANRISAGNGNDTLDGGAGMDVLTGGADNDRFVLAYRGDLNADTITDFTAYRTTAQPGSATGLVVEDDALILDNRLDDGLVGAVAAGIKGLSFSGGNVAGQALAASSFFKGNGFTGSAFGAATGIYVNTANGDVFYNDATAVGSHLIARLGTAGVAGLGASDFLFG